MNTDYDIPLDEYGFDDTPYVTIEEMRELLLSRKMKWSEPHCEELQLDEKSGLYYTYYFAHEEIDLLQEHLLVEQCLEHIDELDWKRITNGYDFDITPRIQHLVENPLVWVEEMPDKLAKEFVVTGRIAEEKSSELRHTCCPFADLHATWYNERLAWFANTLPTCKNICSTYGYYKVPKDMILWDRILTDPYEKLCAKLHAPQKTDPYTGRLFWPYCNPTHFRNEIDRIYSNFGAQKAAQIVRLLRDDWQDIKVLKLFGIGALTPEQIEEFRQCLFEGMDYYLEQWDAETPKAIESKTTKKKPAQQNRNYITFTMSGINVGHINMLRQKLIQVGWIAKDTLPDDFYKLFSGKTNSTKITWTGAVGKGMLLFLFQKMVEQGEIVVPDNHSITTILESHFVDKNGIYISGLNSSKESSKHFPVVNECLNILQLEADND